MTNMVAFQFLKWNGIVQQWSVMRQICYLILDIYLWWVIYRVLSLLYTSLIILAYLYLQSITVYIKEEGRKIVANLILIRITYVLFSMLLHAVYSVENLIGWWVGFLFASCKYIPKHSKIMCTIISFLFQGMNKQVVNDFRSANWIRRKQLPTFKQTLIS